MRVFRWRIPQATRLLGKLLKWHQHGQCRLQWRIFYRCPKRLEAEGLDVPLLMRRLTETLGPAK
ncbi:MAG: hypothetical protein HC888_06400 [Candidatus Competibacteraceae bacterium]|nr:hypothetical protein [Candidatus Competibacteraceae bacterium]